VKFAKTRHFLLSGHAGTVNCGTGLAAQGCIDHPAAPTTAIKAEASECAGTCSIMKHLPLAEWTPRHRSAQAHP
jgi:hypothetical protein